MLKKYLLPVLLFAGIVILFVMYRRQHHLYQEALQKSRQLTSELKSIRRENQTVKQTIQQMQQARAAGPLLKPSFVDQQKYYRQNWKNYIHVSLNNYKTGFLGGVHNLKVMVANNTDYELDRVSVQVQYYRANGDLFKTAHLILKNISPQKSKQASAPESRRGMSVKVHFERITSREMNFCWWINKKVVSGATDPYRCAGSDNEAP